MAAAVSTQTAGDAIERLPQDIISALSTSPHLFLQPTTTLHTAAINAVKGFLDPLATTVSEAQAQRRDEIRRKRKRSTYEDEEESVLHIKQLYTEGFDVTQIWEEAQRILDAAQGEVLKGLQELQEVKDTTTPQAPSQKLVRFEEDHEDEDSEDEEDMDVADLDGLSDQQDLNDLDDVLSDEDDIAEAEDFEDDDIPSEDIEDEDDYRSDGEGGIPREETEIFVQDPHGLNDGFFSIDDFNRQSQFLEQQDETGDDPGAMSDEEEVDWDADPLASNGQIFGTSTDGIQGGDEEDSDDDGPTLDNMDVNAASDDEDDDMEEPEAGDGGLPTAMGLENTNDIKYSDFFDPPPQKPSKTKRMRALPKTQPPKAAQSPADIESDMQRAVSDVRRDLFDDDASLLSESEGSDAPGGLASLSTHEKQRAKLMSEIRRLEAAAVAKRDWTLSGEARAADRPVNSLIEEDLEFERTGKPVPVITNEITEEIEALIKRRILAREFDEVLRRRPELSSSATTRRGLTEVDDSKPQESLSSIYETEHLRALNPQNYSDKAAEKLKREHAEILNQWRLISSQLDLLSNWNYKPKVPEVNITTVTDAPTISMEDVRPAVSSGTAGASELNALAPQEIYAPEQDGSRKAGEVMLKSGATISREEMSREEKLRRRRREKERAKKAKSSTLNEQAGSMGGKDGSGRKGRTKGEEKKNILDELKRGGVKVIGKKGEVTNVDGKKTNDARSGLVSSASAFKL